MGEHQRGWFLLAGGGEGCVFGVVVGAAALGFPGCAAASFLVCLIGEWAQFLFFIYYYYFFSCGVMAAEGSKSKS